MRLRENSMSTMIDVRILTNKNKRKYLIFEFSKNTLLKFMWLIKLSYLFQIPRLLKNI